VGTLDGYVSKEVVGVFVRFRALPKTFVLQNTSVPANLVLCLDEILADPWQISIGYAKKTVTADQLVQHINRSSYRSVHPRKRKAIIVNSVLNSSSSKLVLFARTTKLIHRDDGSVDVRWILVV
jgi:hypothetical protein